MSGLWFLRWPAIIFLVGFMIRFIGALFKIRHWPSADELITLGSIIGVIGIVYAIIKIAVMKKKAILCLLTMHNSISISAYYVLQITLKYLKNQNG